ncbi:MAG: DNA polymerase III subunit delta [Deltaproteobacteria bacterium]|nr:DNA polymerase III subunit delta [Deltaproteobacteria bacterium]
MTIAELQKKLQRREIPALLFFHGEDTPSLEEALRLTIDSVLQPQQRDFNLHQFSAGDNDIEGILNAVQTLPVFAPRRLVVVKNVQELATVHHPSLIDYLQQPVPETVLLLTAASADKRLRLFQALARGALTVEFPRPKEYQLAELVKERGARRGVRFIGDALALFCQRCGTENLSWQEELEKLFTFLGEKKAATVADVVEATLDGSAVSVFDVINAVGRCDKSASLRLLRQLMDEGAAALFVLSMLVRHFRQLWICATMRRQGAEGATIARQADFRPYFLDKMMDQADHFSAAEYRNIFTWFLETDRALKSGSGNGGPLLESLVARIVGAGKNKGP